MTAWGGQRIRALPPVPPADAAVPVRAAGPVADEWGDDDPEVSFQDDTLDDTVNVAAEALEAAAAAEKRGRKDSGKNVQMDSQRANGEVTAGTGSGPMAGEGRDAPDASSDLAVLIRVASNGAIVTNKGGSEDLAGVVAYTQRLIELVGDLLGLERFEALECAFKPAQHATGANGAPSERCLLFAESNGDTVLVRPRPDGNLQALRDRLGLA
jgi:hypothetical protein